MEDPNRTMSTEQSRRLEEQKEEQEEQRDQNDDSSEVSTQIDSIHDDDEIAYQGESASSASSQPKRDGTAPGDDQSLLDLEQLNIYFLRKEEMLLQLKKKQAPSATEKKEIAILESQRNVIARAISYFKDGCSLQETNPDLAFYQRSAGEALLALERAKDAGKSRLVVQSYQNAFDKFEEAIESEMINKANNAQHPMDDLITSSLYCLGDAHFREAQVEEDRVGGLVWRICEQARQAFTGAQEDAITALRLISIAKKNGEKDQEERLNKTKSAVEFTIARAHERQELGNKFLAKIPRKEPL